MWIHLKNEKKRASLNLNFTRFFATNSVDYKNMLKQIINFYGCSVEEVSVWFKESLETLKAETCTLNNCSEANLEKRYTWFKDSYMKDKVKETNPMIDKIKDFKYKSASRYNNYIKTILKSDDSIFMSMGNICLIYKCLGNLDIKEENNENRLSNYKEVLNKIAMNVGASEPICTCSASELKKLGKTTYIEHDGYLFDIRNFLDFVNKKANVELLWLKEFSPNNHNMLVLRQSNVFETITMVIRCTVPQDEENIITYNV